MRLVGARDGSHIARMELLSMYDCAPYYRTGPEIFIASTSYFSTVTIVIEAFIESLDQRLYASVIGHRSLPSTFGAVKSPPSVPHRHRGNVFLPPGDDFV